MQIDFRKAQNAGASTLLQAEQKNHRFLELDSLRGLAAFAVVMAHFRAAITQVPHPLFAFMTRILGSGAAAVNLFFLLSGFVLTIPFIGRRPPTYPAFLTKRICRIYLPYAAAILLAARLAARLYTTIPTGNPWIDQTWSLPYSPKLLIQHLVMIGQFDNTRLNTAIWSLKVEMRVALVFPLIVLLAKRVTARTLLLACIPATVVFAVLKAYLGHEFIVDTLFSSLLFLSGSLLSMNYRAIQSRLDRLSSAECAGVVIGGFALYQAGDLISFPSAGVLGALSGYIAAWVMACGAAAILMISTVWTPFRHVLHNAVLQWLGTRSYSIYLLHATVLFTLIRLWHGAVLPLSMFLPYVFLTLLIAEIFHRSVELPALLLGRRLTTQSKGVPVFAVAQE